LLNIDETPPLVGFLGTWRCAVEKQKHALTSFVKHQAALPGFSLRMVDLPVSAAMDIYCTLADDVCFTPESRHAH
jgi:hypothetical protein